MQQAMTVVFYVSNHLVSFLKNRGVLSLQIVRNWLACLGVIRRRIPSCQIVSTVDCCIWVELSHWFHVRAAHR